MKKFLALILALVMALSLVACGGNTNKDNGKTGDTSLTGIQYTPLYILKTESEAEGVRYQVVPIRSAISNNLFPDMESTFTDAIAHLRTNTDSDYDSGK